VLLFSGYNFNILRNYKSGAENGKYEELIFTVKRQLQQK
jgi:hypothetical protein